MALPDPHRQKAACDKLADFLGRADTAYAIHYACETLHGETQTDSPRVGAIALHNLANGQVIEYSIRQVAELNHLRREEILPNMAAIERRLLEGLAMFVRQSMNARFVHWNMNTPTFGFAALSHRLEVLGGEPFGVHDGASLDLARVVSDIYGSGYVTERSKLQALMDKNDLVRGGHLSGADEARAMAEGRYRDVSVSSAAKAAAIAEIARRVGSKTLVTDAGLLAMHAGPVRLMWQKMRENPGYTFVGGLLGGFGGMLTIYRVLFGN